MADSPMPTYDELKRLPEQPLTIPHVITDSATKFNPWLRTEDPTRADCERPWKTATHVAPSLLIRHILSLRCLANCQDRRHAQCVARIRKAPRPMPPEDLLRFAQQLFPDLIFVGDDIWGQVRDELRRMVARVAFFTQEIEILWEVVEDWLGSEDEKEWDQDKALETSADARKAGCNVHYEKYHLAEVIRERGGVQWEI